MPVNILMPALSPTMEKGNLAKWLKKEGDKVKPGDVIAEIETDKATMEYEAIDEGTLAKIVVPEGTQDVPVKAVIAVLAEEGEDVKAAAAGAGTGAPAAKAAPPAKPASAPPPPPKEEGVSARPSPSMRSAPAVSEAAPARAAPQASAASVSQPGEGEGTRVARTNRVFSSPLARRLAKEAGIDLARVARATWKRPSRAGGLRLPPRRPLSARSRLPCKRRLTRRSARYSSPARTTPSRTTISAR